MKLFQILLSLLSLGLLAACKKSGYQTKNGSVYYKDYRMDSVDYKSFEALNSVFARDKNRGYYRGVELEPTDGASFTAVDDHYAKDNAVVYFCDNYLDFKLFETTRRDKIIRVIQADAASFEVIGSEYAYAKDKFRAYYQGIGFAVADVASFVPLDPQFGKDSQVGYFQQAPITGSDGMSFAIVSRNFAKDKRTVYYCWNIVDSPIGGVRSGVHTIPNALPDSFTAVGLYYATDNTHAFYKDTLIPEADPATFAQWEELYTQYARDSSRIYFQQHCIKGADRQTFALLTDDYAQDKQTIFYQNHPLPKADQTTFTMLEYGYAKDALHVYYEGKILALADPASFAMVPNEANLDAADKTNSYAAGRRITQTNQP
ncbi:MAG: DKNYY domain-containing protein [Dyadobacter sp.]|uniref:DKNYY domain-containing protein n=1 Tax=Dyadobacter sp. TaxID=1914288 RepID=UPI0032641FFA